MDKIIIGAESAGYELKEIVKEHLLSMGYKVHDVGLHSADDFEPYYEIASKAAKGIQSGEYQKGLLFCGTGMGMSIVANKFKGVYAATVESRYSAKMCKIINNANVLTMGGWIAAPNQAKDMVDLWLSADFTEALMTLRITCVVHWVKLKRLKIGTSGNSVVLNLC